PCPVGCGRSLPREEFTGYAEIDLYVKVRQPVDCLREILQNVAKPQGVTNIRKLGHLNNFIRMCLCVVIVSVGHCEEKFGFTYEQIIICLRLALLSDAKEVRAAGLRALRYLIHDSSVLQKVLRLQVDYLIARCIDIQQSNEVERTQALRLVRKMIAVNALLFPSSIVSSLIAVGSDGRQEHDCMVQACVAIICELALKNPEVVAQKGGLGTILKNVIDCQQNCINEALITTVLHLLNHPYTRQYVRLNVELEQILAPYTDFHYRHNPDTSESLEDREARFLACKMAIVASFRSWSGMQICQPNTLFRCPHSFLYTNGLILPDPSRYQDSWRLSDGFVASEAMMILPQRVKSRPDLVDNYLALVLSAFINHGLLEGLIEVITSGSDHVSVRATILLGELLHMASRILPQSHSHHLHCLPTLVNLAASFSISQEKSLRASGAVNNLKLFHEKKNNQPKPSSLYLDHIIRKAMTTRYYRDQNSQATRDGFILKDREEAFMMILRDSQVLSHKDNLDWNWALITTVLKWPNVNLRSNKDEQIHKFVRRLLFFYKPSSRLFSCLELSHRKARQLTIAGCQFIEFLLKSKEEGQVYLEDLVRDVAQWLSALDVIADSSFQSKGLLTMLSQHYFLLLGTLSAHPFGVKIMEKCTIFQCLLKLCSVKNQDYLLKLTVSTLDYSRDGLARVVLSKILTAATDSCRLYATKYLRVLLRANVEFFSSWGIELLVTQLHDCTKAISMEALDILNEACEEKVQTSMFLSIPKGFSYLNERGYVTKQMEKWQQEYNLKYVDLVEEQLNEALATYRRPADKDRMHQSKQSCQRPNVYLPVHLYGELVHDKTGCELLEAQNVVPDLSYTVRSPILDKWEAIKRLKAALWALGNIGSSAWGLNLLQKENVIPDILALAQECEVLSIRGTCLYVLGLISRTKQGCDTLKQQGWDAVRHTQNELWPVVLAEVDPQLSNELPSSLLSLPSESTNMYRNSESESIQSSKRLISAKPVLVTPHSKAYEADVIVELLHTDRPKTPKSQSPTLPLARSYLAHGHLLGSLSMSGKKLRSISDPKGNRAGRAIWETTPWGLQRNRALTEPAIVYPSTVNPRAMELGITKDAVWSGPGMRPHGHHSTSSAAYSGGRSHSQSFNTGTTTSGISSMSSSPSHETGTGKSSSASDTDCISLDTMVNSHTVCSRYAHRLQSNQPLLSKSKSTSMVPLSSLDMLPNRTQLFKSSSLAASQSLADCSFTYTSPRDALGYWALKQLQQQRIHPSLSRSEVLASPAKDVLITDTITMKAGGLDSKFTPLFMNFGALVIPLPWASNKNTILSACASSRFLSFTCVDKEELLSPINQTILQGSFSIHSTVSIANRRCNDDYIGLALPLDINDMFQVWLAQNMFFRGDFSATQHVKLSDPCHGTPPLKQQGSVTDVLTDGKKDSRWGFTESSLQEHSENCLYCAGLQVLGGQGDGTVCGHATDLCEDPLSVFFFFFFLAECFCVSQKIYLFFNYAPGAKPILEDSITSRALLRKEILRLVVNLSSCVGTKSHEAGLLT
uniref:RPTOR independent companion of MTOR, complex 2b n=1 Tax=Scleropages formosus TaxID=113540 RepID=A0A8C9VSS2_SCLFO